MDGQVLRISGVGVRRGRTELLRNLDWTVEEEDRWVIVGPNGAGKTTLLRIAAAQLFPTEGKVEILGERMGAVDVFELRPRIGFASAALAGSVPGSETPINLVISAGYAIIGRWREEYDPADYNRARAMLVRVGAEHLAERRFDTLSEGERKRVQIARALMADPELLLLDEPAAGLDLGGREDLVRRLGALAGDIGSPAMAMVTHHVEEIPPGFTHGLLLRSGELVDAGPLEQVMTAENLSACFGLPLAVEHRNGRWSATTL